MLDKRQSIIVIPARGGSKRFPRKNVASLNGKPFSSYAVDAGLHARCIDKTYVSTEDPEIASIAIEAGAEIPYERPAHLAEDDVIADTVVDLINNIIEREGAKVSNVVLIQPTSPFVKAEHIDAAITLLDQRPDLSSVTTLSSVDHRFHPYNLSFKQGEGKMGVCISRGTQKLSLPDNQNLRVLVLQIYSQLGWKLFYPAGRFGESKEQLVVDPIYAWDIDYEWELEIAEFFINRGMVDLTHHPYPSDAASKTLQDSLMNIFHRIYRNLVVKFSLSFSTNGLLARAIIHDIEEHSRSIAHAGQRRKTLLALSPEGISWRLGGISRTSGRFRILMLPSFWQERLRHAFHSTTGNGNIGIT